MAFERDFRDFLAASTRVQTHVGSSDAARIRPLRLPNGVTFPAIRFQRITTVRELTHDGPTGKPQVRMQVDSYSDDAGEAVDTAEAVRKTLDGFVGDMGGTKVGVSISDDEDARYEDDHELFRVRQDYLIHHAEATT